MDEWLGFTAIHLPPQAPNVHVDDVRHGIEMQIPHMLQQHRSGNDPSGVAHEIFEKLKGGPAKRQPFVAVRRQIDS
jgi:hypothetical protein